MEDLKLKQLIIDLINRGYSRTQIAKNLHMRNSKLEKICLDNNIKLPKKQSRTFIIDTISGTYKVKGIDVPFHNSCQLYYLIYYDRDDSVYRVSQFGDTYKVIKKINNDNIYYIENIDKKNKATMSMIYDAVNNKKIIFFNSYFNNKFNIKI
jgi:hypothetical protein